MRAKHEKERERHRESVHESESVLRKGLLMFAAAENYCVFDKHLA